MKKIPARVGLQWVKEGFSLFQKRPAELISLLLTYVFVILGLSAIPVAGQILSMLLVPTFSLAFMHACANIEQDQRVTPSLLLIGFRSSAFKSLLMLGSLYLLAATLAIFASKLVDGGVLLDLLSGQTELNEKVLQDPNLTTAMLFAMAVYLPFAMALWYAAPLVGWKKMGIFKSLFYSFFAILHAPKAFMMYGISWTAIVLLGLTLTSLVIIPLAALVGRDSASALVLIPFFVAFTAVTHCSFYRSYIQLFETGALSAEAG